MDERKNAQEASDSDFVQILCLEEEIKALEQNIIIEKEKLEHLESELALTKQKKRETENQIGIILKNAEKKDQEFREEIRLLTEQKNDLEKQCRNLSDTYGLLSDDLNKITQSLQDKNEELRKASEELRKAKDELTAVRREKKSVSKKRKLASEAVSAAVIGLIAVIFFGWNYFNREFSELESAGQEANVEKEEALAKLAEMERTYQDTKTEGEEALAKVSELESLYQDTKTEKEKVEGKLSELETYAGPVMIKVNSIYNSVNRQKISNVLRSSEMRYLTFDLDVYFLEDNIEKATIYLDIYKPDGSLFRSSSNSPSGHTTSNETEGPVSKIELEGWGWGNSSESHYPAGTYRVDFIYEGMIIHSQKVEIKS